MHFKWRSIVAISRDIATFMVSFTWTSIMLKNRLVKTGKYRPVKCESDSSKQHSIHMSSNYDELFKVNKNNTPKNLYIVCTFTKRIHHYYKNSNFTCCNKWHITSVLEEQFVIFNSIIFYEANHFSNWYYKYKYILFWVICNSVILGQRWISYHINRIINM